MRYPYQPETIAAFGKLGHRTVAQSEAMAGMDREEPLLVCMDALLRYAKAYEKGFESKLSEDFVLGPEWLDAAKAIRGLLCGNGAVAHERGTSTDSKDNGMIEEIFWAAMRFAGFGEEDM